MSRPRAGRRRLHRRSAQRRPARHRRVPARRGPLAMIDHLSITTTDLDRAQTFYDAVLGALGYPRVNRRAALDRLRRARARPATLLPISRSISAPAPSWPDNRHWAFRAPSRAAVRAFHAAALAHGGSDDGPPGLRASLRSRLLRSVRARPRWQSHRGRHAPAPRNKNEFPQRQRGRRPSRHHRGREPRLLRRPRPLLRRRRVDAEGRAPPARDLREARPGAPSRSAPAPPPTSLALACCTPPWGVDLLPSHLPHRGRRGQRAGVLHRRRQARSGSTGRPARSIRRKLAEALAQPVYGVVHHPAARRRQHHARRPNAARSMRPRKSPPSPPRPIATG